MLGLLAVVLEALIELLRLSRSARVAAVISVCQQEVGLAGDLIVNVQHSFELRNRSAHLLVFQQKLGVKESGHTPDMGAGQQGLDHDERVGMATAMGILRPPQ